MISLTKGSYLDRIGRLAEDGNIIVSSSLYFGDIAQDRMHCHENTHLSFVITGGYRELRKNSDRDILPGDISFYYAGEYHQSNGTKDFSKNINLEIGHSFFSENLLQEGNADLALKNNPDAKFLLLSIYKELLADDIHSSSSIRMMVHNLLNTSKPTHKRETPCWIKTIRDCLNDRWDEWVTLEELSLLINKHPVTVSRQFHDYFSCTLGEYSRKLKIERSLRLLKDPSYSIINIAHRCGFADHTHYTRNFKRLTGFLPGQDQKL